MARGTVVIAANRCKGCELCTTVCPQEVLHMSTALNAKGYHPVDLIDPQDKCTGCGLCAVICPDVVFKVYRYQAKTPQRAAFAA